VDHNSNLFQQREGGRVGGWVGGRREGGREGGRGGSGGWRAIVLQMFFEVQIVGHPEKMSKLLVTRDMQ
jgi:hypothetical protein